MSPLVISDQQIQALDLTPIQTWLTSAPLDKTQGENQLQLTLAFNRESDDPRELSEIPQCRLWYVRLDSCYPHFPLYLDWKSGELARYAAMLVPHEFHRTEGIQFNPEALEIFTMQKIFVLLNWLKQQEIPTSFRLKSFAKLLGYDLTDSFLTQVDQL